MGTSSCYVLWLITESPNLLPRSSVVRSHKSWPFLVCGLISEADNSCWKRAPSSRVAYYTLFKDPVHVAFTAPIHKKSPGLGAVFISHGTLTLPWQTSSNPFPHIAPPHSSPFFLLVSIIRSHSIPVVRIWSPVLNSLKLAVRVTLTCFIVMTHATSS